MPDFARTLSRSSALYSPLLLTAQNKCTALCDSVQNRTNDSNEPELKTSVVNNDNLFGKRVRSNDALRSSNNVIAVWPRRNPMKPWYPVTPSIPVIIPANIDTNCRLNMMTVILFLILAGTYMLSVKSTFLFAIYAVRWSYSAFARATASVRCLYKVSPPSVTQFLLRAVSLRYGCSN